LFMGDHKIVINRGPLGDGQWHLFNIVTDPGETEDLAAAMPARMQQMLQHYQDYSAANGVLPVAEGYDQIRQVVLNGLRDRLGGNILLLLLTVLVVTPFYLLYRAKRRQLS
jgi:hypothetical protein